MDNLLINKAVIHELVKEQHKPIKKSRIRNKTLNPKLEPVKILVEGVTELYGKKNNTAHYGTFENGEGRGKFPDAFNVYAQIERPKNLDFLNLSLVAMNTLYQAAQNSMPASGGYILLSDYSNTQGRFFIVAMIKTKNGLTLSEELIPEELAQLDLSRLYQAAKINFSKLSAYKLADGADKQDLNYLSFVSPSSNQSAAGYFVTALGCSPGTAAAMATRAVIKEGFKFFQQHEELKKSRFEFKSDLLGYMWEKQEKGESVKLSEVEKIARKYIPADEPGKADKIADEFVAHLNSEDAGVPDEFPPTKRVLNSFRKIHYKADDWDFTFERSALGEDDGAKVYYDRSNKRLILNDLPDKFITLIHDELNREKENKT